MSVSLHKQPVHVAIRIQQEWADATARIRSLIPQVPANLVEHFAKSLATDPIDKKMTADEEHEPPPAEKDPATEQPAAAPSRATQRRAVKRD